MQRRRYLKTLYWLLPVVCYAADANAWGLYTHVYFAQSLLMATPLLDARFRNCIKQFPELVMAGACLPDLAIMAKSFSTTHQWQKAEYLLAHATTAQESAIALGYLSHLYVDVIAHHHFVPAHEALWSNASIYTHIGAEWAMDAHIAHQLLATPTQLLTAHAVTISRFIAPCFGVTPLQAKKQLLLLAYADKLLRCIKLPAIIYRCIQLRNRDKYQHFDYYLNTTWMALNEFQKLLTGLRPRWEPEQSATENQISRMRWRMQCLQELHIYHEMPIHYFTGTPAIKTGR